MNLRNVLSLLAAAIALQACAYYTTPGQAASLPSLTEPDIADAMARKPGAQFPAHIVIARVQAAGYQSESNEGYGSGTYSVLTTRDFETEEDFARLGAMPDVAGLGPLNRFLLPARLGSVRELRSAAAQLRGDILLLYTVDTVFRTEGKAIGPMQLVTLGFLRNQNARVTATCATIFVDVRTGFVHGIAEGTAVEEQKASVWGTNRVIEEARFAAERRAFQAAIGEVEKAWNNIRKQQANVAANATQ